MQFQSTRDSKNNYALSQVVLTGLAPDGGLFVPKKIPALSSQTIKKFSQKSINQIALAVLKSYFSSKISLSRLKQICESTFNFPVPLEPVESNLYCLELFHGPTLAFKDFGARFMARITKELAKNQEITILAATSGDTGSAVAHGFFQIPGVRVYLLYPQGKVSQIQEKQLTTLGSNIHALEVQGDFDDCQRLVKQAFLDKDLNRKISLVSANSINFVRLIGQAVYYFYSFSRLKPKAEQSIVYSVPSGNFGNLTAAIIAKKMGLPIAKLVASINRNQTFLNFLQTGQYRAQPSKSTLSNAMDVGNPSNFERIWYLYQRNLKKLKNDLACFSINDHRTKKAIIKLFKQQKYLVDPHTAVAYQGLKDFQKQYSKPMLGVFLATAHPGKFQDIIQPLINKPVPIPQRLEQCLKKPKKSHLISNQLPALKSFLYQL
ncbi:MAG: threonine synthase [Candidatus Moranbacteria bacterium]|nr:threonine synthase [Candidatus Moranbacteria bacterium]